MKTFDLTKTDRKLAILIDPDEHALDDLFDLVQRVEALKPDYIFIGGSLIFKSKVSEAAEVIRRLTSRKLVLFPGHFTHLTDKVDAVLLLSLISGRNPELLIGQHVLAAPKLKRMSAEVVSTGYMLVDGGKPTSVSYISHTQPIPHDKPDIALCTAQAGELIGMRCMYLDAGSGANQPVSESMVSAVANGVAAPLIVGGGIRNMRQAETYWQAGANLVVIGNAFQEIASDEALQSFQENGR